MTDSTLSEELLKQLDQLPPESQKKVLEFARALNAINPKGKPGKDLLKFAGTIDSDSLKIMEKAVEYGCESGLNPVSIVKDEARKIIESLPEQATWEDIMYQFYIKRKIEVSLKAFEEGKVISHEAVIQKLFTR
ncbi:MAG TPA: hypothetical protein VHY08_27815 [Bacillota bacterium]|nr:hypothetical protein [Bacillota bacterium]